MKSTYKPYNYSCPNCSLVQKHYGWNEDSRPVCDTGGCGTVLLSKDIIRPKKEQVTAIRTPTKNR